MNTAPAAVGSPAFARFLIFGVITGLAATAEATTSSVFGPGVDAGERALEYRLSYAAEEERFDQRLHYQQALGPDLRARLIAAQRRRGAGDLELAYWRIETQWQYLRGSGSGWDAAVRGEVQIAEGDDGPHRLRIGWTGSRDLSTRWQQRVNLLAGREIGGGRASGIAIELRAQTTYAVSNGGRLGLELFSDLNTTTDFGGFDDQEHQLGPIFKQKVGERWAVNTSVLVGISDAAPDLAWRLLVERSL